MNLDRLSKWIFPVEDEDGVELAYADAIRPRRAEEWRELLLQHLDEDERRWTPKTVAHSGDGRGRLTASCAGPSGTGDCQAQWSIGPDGDRDEWPWLIHEHSMTHATYEQLWHLVDIDAKRRVIAKHGDDAEVLVALLLPYGLPREDEEV